MRTLKTVISVVLVGAIVLSMAACQQVKSGSVEKAELVEENGVLTCVDTSSSPFDDCGIHTVVDASAGTVTFTKTDKNGADTLEYLKFTPSENSVEKYYYVSMMGTGFYYYFDIDANEMVRMEDSEHEDSTEAAKEKGRFDGAASEMKTEVAALEEYFKTQFGMSIADAAAGK